MAGVDQILRAIVQQSADEVRFAADQVPVVLGRGLPRHFTLSPTPETVLRQLLGPLLTPARLDELERAGRSAFDHQAPGVGHFEVVLSRGENGLEARFVIAGQARASGNANDTNVATARAMDAAVVTKTSRAVAPAENVEPKRNADAKNDPSPPPPEQATLGQTAREKVTLTARLLELVELAVRKRASDLHLADTEPPYLRADGVLERIDSAPAGVGRYLELAEATRAELERGHAVDLALELAERQRLRLSVYSTRTGLAAAIRLLPRTAPTLETLDLPLSLADLAELPHGLVLFAGATGSGKSTSMAALCRRALERRSVVLVTLEEPIEFALDGSTRSVVRQREIGRDVVDYTTGLRDALRSDPDIIMVGELRDAETIRLALTAAETGHLVFASLHSGSATGVIERVVDAYPSEQRAEIRTQFADALRAIVVQRLLPRARGSGRIPALEVLRATHAVQNLVREGKTAQLGSVLQSGSRDGMLSLERCLADYVRAGLVSVESARAAANNLDSLAMYLAK
jgi:twitching motility protein PilT